MRGRILRTSRVQYLSRRENAGSCMRERLACARTLRAHYRRVREELRVDDCERLNVQPPLNHIAKLEGLRLE